MNPSVPHIRNPIKQCHFFHIESTMGRYTTFAFLLILPCFAFQCGKDGSLHQHYYFSTEVFQRSACPPQVATAKIKSVTSSRLYDPATLEITISPPCAGSIVAQSGLTARGGWLTVGRTSTQRLRTGIGWLSSDSVISFPILNVAEQPLNVDLSFFTFTPADSSFTVTFEIYE